MGETVDWRTDVFSTGVVLFELLALQQLFREQATEAAIDEVDIAPSPDVRERLPGLDLSITGLVSLAIAKDPLLRPNAAMFGMALDKWCAKQRSPGSPDRLQSHLAKQFPASYRPPTSSPRLEPPAPKKNESVWAKVFGS